MRFLLLICLFWTVVACTGDSPEDADFYESIGEQIRTARINKGISQAELAAEVKLSQNSLSLIEDGMATPIHDKILAIEAYLDADFEINGKPIEVYLETNQ